MRERRSTRKAARARDLLVVFEGPIVLGELELVLHFRGTFEFGARRRGCERVYSNVQPRHRPRARRPQRSEATHCSALTASTTQGEGCQKAPCIPSAQSFPGVQDSPPSRDCSETRMVETESAGDHFSLRMSVEEIRPRQSGVREGQVF